MSESEKLDIDRDLNSATDLNQNEPEGKTFGANKNNKKNTKSIASDSYPPARGTSNTRQMGAHNRQVAQKAYRSNHASNL